MTNATQVMSDLSVLRFDLGLKVWLNTPYQVKRGIPRDTPERVRLDKVGRVCYTYPTSPPKGEQPLDRVGTTRLDKLISVMLDSLPSKSESLMGITTITD